MSTLSFEVGMTACSCIALLALRMRVSMSAIGSVSISVTSCSWSCPGWRPGGRAPAGRYGTCRTCGTSPGGGRSGCSACSCASCTSQAARPSLRATSSPLLVPSRLRERKADAAQERARIVVGLRGGRDRDVQAPDGGHAVVVDLREDDLLADSERVVAAPVERVRVEAAEVADARQRDRDQPVEELPHAVATERDLHADRHALANLELRDRLAGAAHLCALPGDDRQLVEGGVDLLRVGLALADAHVERDLLDRGRLHDRRQLELLLQLAAELVVVARLQARDIGLGGCHYLLSISWPQPSRLQTRTFTVSPFTSLNS